MQQNAYVCGFPSVRKKEPHWICASSNKSQGLISRCAQSNWFLSSIFCSAFLLSVKRTNVLHYLTHAITLFFCSSPPETEAHMKFSIFKRLHMLLSAASYLNHNYKQWIAAKGPSKNCFPCFIVFIHWDFSRLGQGPSGPLFSKQADASVWPQTGLWRGWSSTTQISRSCSQSNAASWIQRFCLTIIAKALGSKAFLLRNHQDLV